MSAGTELTDVEMVRERGSWLFTVVRATGQLAGTAEEVILVPCEDEVEAWSNVCTHESQRLDRGMGAAMRDGEIICPKHGSMFDACTGYCGNGKAADSTLPNYDVTVEEGVVYLTDDTVSYSHEGGIEEGEDDESGNADDGDGDDRDDDEGPSSTSHLTF